MIKQGFVWTWVGLALFLSACGSTLESVTPSPEISETPNEILVTPDVTRQARELPPTWTPTYTPTITHTPTLTPSFTPTLSPTPIDPDDLCADYVFATTIVDGDTYGADNELELSYGISETYPYVYIGFALSHADVEEDLYSAEVGGTTYNAYLSPSDFPAEGRWDYRAGVFIIDEEDVLCTRTGYFFIEAGTIVTGQTTIPTALPVPSVTPLAETTQEALIPPEFVPNGGIQ